MLPFGSHQAPLYRGSRQPAKGYPRSAAVARHSGRSARSKLALKAPALPSTRVQNPRREKGSVHTSFFVSVRGGRSIVRWTWERRGSEKGAGPPVGWAQSSFVFRSRLLLVLRRAWGLCGFNTKHQSTKARWSLEGEARYPCTSRTGFTRN